jgi:hypothetical protein
VSTSALLGAVLSAGVILVALALGFWQWHDCRLRPTGLSPEDHAFFRNQELRRWTVFALMLVVGVLLLVGTRISHLVGGQPNPLFVQTWIVILALVFALFMLALFDWVATGRYARRHRQEITREGLEILRDELRRRAALRRAEPPTPSPESDFDGAREP